MAQLRTLACLILIGCGSAPQSENNYSNLPPAPSGGECTPNISYMCECPGGYFGEQMCNSEGSLDPCWCRCDAELLELSRTVCENDVFEVCMALPGRETAARCPIGGRGSIEELCWYRPQGGSGNGPGCVPNSVGRNTLIERCLDENCG